MVVGSTFNDIRSFRSRPSIIPITLLQMVLPLVLTASGGGRRSPMSAIGCRAKKSPFMQRRMMSE